MAGYERFSFAAGYVIPERIAMVGRLLAAALLRSTTEAEAVTQEVLVVARLAHPIAVAPPSELGTAASELRPVEQAMLMVVRRALSDPGASDINDGVVRVGHPPLLKLSHPTGDCVQHGCVRPELRQ